MKRWLHQVRESLSQERAEARRASLASCESDSSSGGGSGQEGDPVPEADSEVATAAVVVEAPAAAEAADDGDGGGVVRERRQRAGKNSYYEFMERPSYLFVWGEGAWGKLGHGDGGADEWSHPPDEPEPRQCLDEQLRGKQIARVVCHKRHSYVLTEEGQMFAFGSNPVSLDILGVGRPMSLVQPTPQVSHQQSLLAVKDFAAGDSLSQDVHVYGWGLNNEGQLAIKGGLTHVQVPTLVEALLGCNIVQVACGEYHSLYLTEDGRVYSSGKNVEGQLGLGNRRSERHVPHLITTLNGHKIVQVACGDFHSAALTDTGALFTWGNGLYGQLGHSSETSSATPLLVHACEGLRVIYVACGAYHTAAIIEGGDVLVWGAGDEGQLGQDDLSYVSTPTFCDALRGRRICQVSCGAAITAAISVDGCVWVWGKLLRRYSQPTLVMDADDRVNQISCGSNNMAAWQGPLSPFLASVRDQVAKVVDPTTLLSVALQAIIDKEEGSDSYLLVGDTETDGQGRRIHTHAIILAVRCARMQELMEDEWKTRSISSTSKDRVCIRLPPDVSYKAAAHFLEYLYCDVLRLTPDHYAAYARRQAKQQSGGLTGEEEQEEEDEENEETQAACKVVEDLLQLCRRFEIIVLEEEINRRVAMPQQLVSHSTSFISNTLSLDLARAFDNPLFSDLTVRLTCDDDDEGDIGGTESQNDSVGEDNGGAGENEAKLTTIRAHKCILGARSRYFNAMLLSGLKESYMGEMVVAHVRPSLFVDLMRYLYTGDAAITPEGVVELFLAASEYSIDGLVKQCERMIENALEMEIVADLWAMGSLHSSEELKQVCVNFVLKEISAVNKATTVEALRQLSPELIEVVCSRLRSQLSGDALTCATCGQVFMTEYDKLAAKENACCLCHRPVCRSSDESDESDGGSGETMRRCRLQAPMTPLLPPEGQDDGVCLRCRQLLDAYTPPLVCS